ncbi:MAG: hypothetical protein ROO71_10110 [Balneola sp.]
MLHDINGFRSDGLKPSDRYFNTQGIPDLVDTVQALLCLSTLKPVPTEVEPI